MITKSSKIPMTENEVNLTVCVIGRNEESHLRECAFSIQKLNDLNIVYETLFVDSASSDNSVKIANKTFDKVIRLAEDKRLNAGAARHMGTLHSKGVWILYLDGDMEISSEILPVLSELIKSRKVTQGVCGFTQNIYPDGSQDLIVFSGNREGHNCNSFGGAVLLPRRAVLEVGNWSCELFSYEEAELYSRLLQKNIEVKWSDKIMVLHNTPIFPLKTKILGSIFPNGSFLGKKYYGAGQATLFSLRNGSFVSFCKLKPEPYLMLLSVIVFLLLFPALSWPAFIIPSGMLVTNIFRVGIRGALNYTFWIPQVALGLWKLPKNFTPEILQIDTRSLVSSISNIDGNN